jgi:hypothetical protein
MTDVVTEKPESEPKSESPYRAQACEVCRAREEASSQMLPFVEFGKRVCAECKASSEYITYWGQICRGSGHYVLKNGFWFLRRWGQTFIVCEIPNAPKHFHFKCNRCDHRWMELTATEKLA